MRRLAMLCLLLLPAACLPGVEPGEPQAPIGTEAHLKQQETVCAARGGRFGPAPGGAVRVCFVTPADANTPCLRKSDCEGQCLARSRTCAPIAPLYGCNEVLLENGQRAEFCLD